MGQPVEQRVPAVEAHDEGDPRALQLAIGEHLRLAVGDGLQGMLQVAQEAVALLQLVDHRGRQVALPGQGVEHLEQRSLLQAEVAPAVDQLEGLGDELHLADAAGAELDVLGHALAPHLLLDQLLHAAQRLDGREVQVAAIDERPQHLLQLRAGGLVAADHREP